MQKGSFAHLAEPGALLTVRVTANARRDTVFLNGGKLHVSTTEQPEDGKANAAVRRNLAHALGVSPSRVTLTSGETSREKIFRIT
ncbi:MAG: DUF167 domain-containing protein [Vannielia sp.]|uniref:DUF167 domain-containing protein n=1 Tax=Rhodobacterales TaxID=204455 RepID=UPI0020956820|nr:DUF167 domain-containing protein [Oceanicola sp. 502str15]MCO6383404.1 DUF167 domain-containing protein [Oceanicola sp. 502str15]